LRLINAVSVLEKNADKRSKTMSRPNNRPNGTSSLKKGDPLAVWTV
jgi:hypothetical protein